jgi:hypothetical protein
MKAVLSSMLIAIFVSVAGAEELALVARVDFATLKPLLLEVAFARPQNKDLQTQYLATKQKHDDMMNAYTESRREGKRVAPHKMDGAMEPSGERDDKKKMEHLARAKAARAEVMMNKLMASRRVNNLTRAELILIIEKLYKDKYQVVISKTYKDSVLYTTGPISDITASIKQHLLKQKVVEETTTKQD